MFYFIFNNRYLLNLPVMKFCFLLFSAAFFFVINLSAQAAHAPKNSHAYYISSVGNDSQNGSLQHPWKSFDKLNDTPLQPGDKVYLKGGDTLTGTLYLRNLFGNQNLPIVIQSYGNKNAVIAAKDSAAIVVDSCSYLSINGITLIGSGRKEGNTKDGMAINNSHDIQVQQVNVSRFQKSGLLIHNSTGIEARNISAHDNGFAGIYVSGEYGDKLHCRNIKLINCHAENNPGDPTNFGNHSGNGILAGFCTNILIDSCVANNNGWDMPRKGNGPVGIWCYEADSIVIQHCISYENKTSKGGEDGGGYDLDGGTTNSVIQYCLSYRNQGSAFGIFQYDGASPWHDNVIRFCISENDGNVSAAHANAYVWNSSHDSSQFKNFLFYNNTLYNDKNAALSYSTESEHSNFRFYNNIFVANNKLITGNYDDDVFLGNDWWSLTQDFKIDSITNFKRWASHYNKEQINGKLAGFNVKPPFKKAGKANADNTSLLSSFINYQFVTSSLKSLTGVDLEQLFGIHNGGVNFNGLPVKCNGIGACSK